MKVWPVERRHVGSHRRREVGVRRARVDRGIGVEHRRADRGIVRVESALERVARAEAGRVAPRLALGRGEVDHHDAVERLILAEALQIVLDLADGGAVPAAQLVAAVDVRAIGGAARRPPWPHRVEARRAVEQFLLADHAVPHRTRAERVLGEVPAAKREVAIGDHAVDRTICEREPVEAVRSRLDHLDPRDRGGGDRAADPDHRDAHALRHACSPMAVR
jgi:hypothetical protein